jgi:hypothetical protein
MTSSCGDQSVGLLDGGRERLFHQYRDAHLERAQSDLRVSRRGHRDCDGLGSGQQVVDFDEGRRAKLRRDFLGARRVQIADTHQMHLIQPGEMPSVVLP